MVKVRIWGSLQKATDNKEFVEVEAENFKQLLDNLSLKYPKLKPQISRGVSIAIDGGWCHWWGVVDPHCH